jgi:hypothetical protein
MYWDSDITLGDKTPKGKMQRLIVVGINSFNGKNNNNTQHVVFQFQNIPVRRRMNPKSENNPHGTNEGGYKESEMRKYLTGNFLSGLTTTAGVPDGVLWAPARVLSAGQNGTGYDKVSDLLWLPTEREMFQGGTGVHEDGKTLGPFSAYEETAENQARLEYYSSNESRVKVYKANSGYPAVMLTGTYGPCGNWYWESSAHYGTGALSFCAVRTIGAAGNDGASVAGGCAPAFCVKYYGFSRAV